MSTGASMRTILLILLCSTAWAVLPGSGLAQSASEVAAARSLFEEGVAAAGDSRWAEALSAFERSYAIAPRSSTLLNLAGAQVQLGQLVAASESYRRLIRDAGDDRRERRLREQAQEALTALERRIAHLTISVADLAGTDTVLLDDAEIGHAIVGVATPVDPGSHEIVVRRGGREIGRASSRLGEGESADITVVLRASAAVASEGTTSTEPTDTVPDEALVATNETNEGGEDIAASPILWTIVGVVVVGGVVAAVVATQVPTSPTYYEGNLGDGMIRF